MLTSAFIKKPHQLDPNGENYDYLNPRYKFFSHSTNIAQKQPLKKHDFKTDMDKVKFDYGYKKAMTQHNYPDKINYKFYKTNKDEYVGGAKEDENLHARKMRLLRIQAENFEKGEANTLKNVADTVPFSEDRGTFIQILQNLAEIRSNVGTGETLKEVKPERLNSILGQTMNSGINFNKKQLNQLRQVIEEILNNSIKTRIIQNKPKFLTMLKIYAVVIHLLATVNTQDNEIRKGKLEAFIDTVLDQPAQIIAQALNASYPSLVHLPKAELFEKADTVDSIPKPKNVRFSPPPRNTNPMHQTTPRQSPQSSQGSTTPQPTTKKELLKLGDRKTWDETSNGYITTLLKKPELEAIATKLGLNYDSNDTKPTIVKMIKEAITQDIPITPEASANASATPHTQYFTPVHEQTPGVSTRSQRARQIDFENADNADEMPPLETPEEEAKRTGEGRKKRKGSGKQQVKVTGGFYPNRRSLLRFLK